MKEEIQSEMAIAPGGFINQTIVRDPVASQTWDIENSIMFNLQLLNASKFEELLGYPAPETPITPELYRSYGYPFFKLYEEKSGIKGEFRGLKSVGTIDEEKGIKKHIGDSAIKFPVIELNKVDRKNTFKPVAELEAELKRLRIVSSF